MNSNNKRKTMNLKKIKLAALASCLALCSSFAQAGTASATVNGSVSVAGTCSFNQPTYTLSITGSTGQKPTGSVQMYIQCSTGLSPSLQQNYAVAYSGSGAVGEVELVAYKDSGFSQPLSGSPINLVADNNMNAYTIYYVARDYQSQGPLQKIGNFEISMPMQVTF